MFKSMSLKVRVIISVAISLSLVAGILAFTNYGYMKKQKEDALTHEVNSSLSLLTKGLSEWLEIRISMVEATAKQYSLGFDLNELLTTGQQAGSFIYMYVGTPQGQMIMVPPEDLPDDYDPRQRPWYKAATASNKTVVTEPYADATSGDMVVTFATNVPGNGGVMSADLSLQGIVETILLSDFGGLGYAVLVNNEGDIIAHPNAEWTLKSISEFSSDLSVSDMTATSQSGELLVVDSSEGKKITSFKAIPDSNWFVGYLLDENIVNKPIKQMLSVGILTSVLVAAGALVLVLLLLNSLLRPLRTLANAMKEVSSGDGDLTRRLQVRGNDELSLIAFYFNEFVSKIQQLVSDAHESATEVDKFSKELELESITSEEGVGRQMHEIEQVAAAIQEMSHTAADVASHANESSVVAQKANDMSETGLSEASQTSAKMQNLASEIKGATEVIEELNTHAQNINSILSTIQGIAEQTNLLALNAAIEAARAGEQGRGFAVVADEVRVLSQRTHESTEEIQSMIEQLQSRTGNAVTLMNRSENLTLETVDNMKAVSDSIQGINSGVHEITDMATRIAEASSQQNIATDEISRIATAISDASTSLSESAKNTRQLSGNMNTTASQLNNHLNKFKL